VSTKRGHRPGRGRSHIANKPRFYTICACALLILITIIFTSLAADAFGNENICSGVTVGGIKLGGLSAEEAAAALESIAEDPYASSSVTITAENGSSITILAADIDLCTDIDATVENARSIAKSGNLLGNMFSAFGSRLFGKSVPLTPKYDTVKLDALLLGFAEEVGGTLKPHEVEIEEEEIIVTPGHAGQGINTATAKEKFAEAITAGEHVSITIATEEAYPAAIDLAELHESTIREPEDATYAKTGSKSFVITEEINGRELDIEKAKELLKDIDKATTPIKIPFDMDIPSVTKAELEGTFFAQTLGRGSTNYATSNVPRSNNVELAAKYIDGTILLPGEVFSYNESVGPRTGARGFREASIYENNKMVDGMGGGICQTSSTMYIAVLNANLDVVERHEHSLEVTYAPLGIDATVAYGYLDFRFRNNTNAPMKIDVSWGGGTVSVALLGTNPHPNRTVKVTTNTVSTTPFTTNEVPDPSLPEGKTEEESKGFKGSVVNTYMTIYENGVEIDHKFLHKSTYHMSPRTVKVGTGPAAATPEPEPSAEPEPSNTPETTPTPTSSTPTPTASPVPTDSGAEQKPDGL